MSETMIIKTDDGEFSAYVARPSATRAPVIVVLQEILGVNAGMRQTTDEIAAAGFIAICPDLFWRLEPNVDLPDGDVAVWEKAFDLYNRFDLDKGVDDAAAAVAVARTMPGSTGKVGVMGFCLGGLLTYLVAARRSVDAAVAYHGAGTEKYLDEADGITLPMMMHLAGEDEYIPQTAQDQIREVLGRKSNVQVFDYPGRRHAFARNGGKHYHSGDAHLANERTREFFLRTLS